MKHIFPVLILIVILISCDRSHYRNSAYSFSIENQSTDTLVTCFSGRYDESYFISERCYELWPESTTHLITYAGKGMLVDYWSTDDSGVLEELKIYKDSMLVEKDFLQRDLWIYNELHSERSQYLLVISDEDIN